MQPTPAKAPPAEFAQPGGPYGGGGCGGGDGMSSSRNETSGQICGLHLGTPCTSFSRTRGVGAVGGTGTYGYAPKDVIESTILRGKIANKSSLLKQEAKQNEKEGVGVVKDSKQLEVAETPGQTRRTEDEVLEWSLVEDSGFRT
jgi:hypothetical protein